MTAAALSGGTWLKHWRRWAPVAVLIGLCVIIGISKPNFFSLFNLIGMLNVAAIPTIICMGATFIILMGSIDLSAEGVIAICAVAASMLVANDYTGNAIGPLAVPIAILIGGSVGLLNGIIHVKLRVPSFMTTLGVGFAGIGVATAILGGLMVRITDTSFRNYLSLGRFLGIPAAVYIAGIAVAVAWIAQDRLFTAVTAVVVGGTALSGGVGSVLNSVVGVSTRLRIPSFIATLAVSGVVLSAILGMTPFGRLVRGIGAQERAVMASGIDVDRIKIAAYTLSGTMAGIAGVVMAARLGSGSPTLANEFLLPAIACIVVGGTAITGGVGSVWRTFIGALIVQVVRIGMTFIGVSVFAQQIVFGFILVAAVAVTMDRTKVLIIK